MEAKDFMTKSVITCNQNQTVEEAAKLMTEKLFSVMPVVDDQDNLVGILTQSDFVGKEVDVPHALASIKRLFGHQYYMQDIEPIYANAKQKKLSEVMTKDPITAKPETSLSAIVDMMATKKLKRVPVVENNKVVGMITRKDLIKAFVKA